MYKCPNKNLPEWKELEKVVPEVAYTIWDMNNGHGIDKAPNGEPSILFDNLIQKLGNREEAIKAKAKIFSRDFIQSKEEYAKDSNGEPIVDAVLTLQQVTYNEVNFDLLNEDQIRVISEVSNTYNKIQKGLKDRLNAIKRYSNKSPKVWRQLQTLIQQLSNSETEQGMLQFMEHIDESVKDSIQFLNRPIEDINSKQIRQLSNDYVGFYKPLIDDIAYLVDTTDLFKDKENYQQIKDNLSQLQQQLNQVNNKFINVLKSKGYQHLKNFLKQQGMPNDIIQETINWLDDPKHDSNMFMNWFGMATNSNNAVQQTIAKTLNDVKNATDRETLDVGIKLTKTLKVAKDKYGNDVQKLLYEKLDDGTYSGLRVKPLNYGQMSKNRKEFLQKLAEKLSIEKDSDGQYILPQDENIQNKWYTAINNWYNENADRKYKSEYYTARNKILSLKTRDAVNEIQKYIDNLVSPITIDGVEYTNLLSESKQVQLEQLRKQKSLLSNPYNLDGSEKTGDDAIIAKELSEFNKLVSEHIKYKTDKTKYGADRAKVASKYGEGSEELKLWENRNTVEKYTQEFYDRIDNLNKVEQSDIYQDLVQKRRQLQQLFKDPRTGKIDVTQLSDTEKAALLQLDQDIADVTEFKTKEETESNSDKFSDFAEMAFTDQYFIDMDNAKKAGTQAYNDWFMANHYEDKRGYMQAASYYKELKPLPQYIQQYTERAPINKYSTLDPSSDWYNDNWDPNGPSIQPKKDKYNNKKAYDAMANKPEVLDLYNQIEEIMSLANSYVSFMQFANDSRMPQIPARFMQALNRKDGLLSKLGYAFEDLATTKADDLDFVEEFATMPNGDPIKVIPTRFIKMLDDPNTISTDAVAATVQYYNMAANYKNMSKHQDDIELMLNLLKQVSIKTRKDVKGPGSTNVYKQSQLLVDRLMYGRNKSPILVEAFGKEYNVGKMLDIARGFVTKVNLSGNLWSIGTSFFTDATYTTLEAKMGKYFDLEDLNFAKSEFFRQLPDMMANIGNPIPNGKVPYLLMLNQVVKDNRELFDRLDQSQVLRSINQNFWFAGYTQADYTVKSHTLLSIYHNYRFVDGEGFLSKQQYIDKFYSDDRKKGAVAFKQLSTTLYDAYITNNKGEVSVDSKYSKYVTEKLLNDVRNRIDILSKRIDGTLREVDKAAVHASSIASYLVLHRNFMVSALQDRFKKRQYNLDLGAMEEGYYRSTGKFLSNVLKNKHFALTQLLADYNNMKDYEQYGVRRVLNELMLVAGSTSVAIAFASLVDGDDDYDMWLTQSITYLAMRSAFEFRTMYNPFELISLIKSPTAAFNWFDNLSSFINLINPFAYTGNRTPFTIIDRGVYKGMPVILKNIIKVTPFKSAFEAQYPKTKRNYLQNQLMNF